MSRSLVVKLVVGIAIVSIVVVCYVFLKDYASLEYVKSQRAAFADYYEANRGLVLAAFFAGYVAVTAFSLPGAAVMTLVAGALFGVWVGTLLVSFASTIGATLAFLVARFVLGESLQAKYGDRLKVINDGMEREGAFYLFALRLIPAFPFFLVNLLMALTRIPIWTFYWVSQTGMLAGTVAYVYAGTELAKVESAGDVLSPTLLMAFVVLGLLPLVAKRGVAWVRMRRQTTAE